MFTGRSAACNKHVQRGLKEVLGDATNAEVTIYVLKTVEDKRSYVCYCGKPADYFFGVKSSNHAQKKAEKENQNRQKAESRSR